MQRLFLYKKNKNTYIKIMISLLIIFLLIFPFFISINGIFIKKDKKLYINVSLFGKISIINGYFQLIKEGVAFHISSNKAIILPFKNILENKIDIKAFSQISILKFECLTELGNNENILKPIIISNCFNTLFNIFSSILSNKKPYLKLKNNINIYEKDDIFNQYLKIQLVFNIVSIITVILKILTEKINEIRKTKQTKQYN